jgi:vacuolar-type H+-ATPase subunit F/Vma7
MKYFLSLCCIIKNERYLEEFIMYYRLLGVEHFYIYDNESNVKISDRLNKDYYKKMCTIINFPGKIQQLNAYNNCIQKCKKETKWLIIVDGDEYILPKKKEHVSIRDFLKDYKNYHAIGINWMMFGSSFHDHVQPGFITDNYRYCDGTQNKHIKTICRPEFVVNIENPHYVILQDPSKYADPHKRKIGGPFNEHNTIDIIQINHYWGKSLDEHYEKRDRGRATTHKVRVICDNPHENHNKVIDNLLADKYLHKLNSIKNNIK